MCGCVLAFEFPVAKGEWFVVSRGVVGCGHVEVGSKTVEGAFVLLVDLVWGYEWKVGSANKAGSCGHNEVVVGVAA